MIHVSFFLFQCGNIQEILWRDSKSLSENYESQIFFTVSPFVSLYYEPSSFQARYVILRSQFGKNEMIQGNLKYLELSRKSEQSGKILLEVSEWRGGATRDSNDNRKIEFSPALVIKRLKTSSMSESPTLEPRKEVLNDVKRNLSSATKENLEKLKKLELFPESERLNGSIAQEESFLKSCRPNLFPQAEPRLLLEITITIRLSILRRSV